MIIYASDLFNAVRDARSPNPMRVSEKHFCRTTPNPDTGCMLWTGSVERGGYGLLRHPNGKGTTLAHRAFYEEERGKIPDGLVLDHLCRVRCCVNPYHLEAVTQKENLRRGNGLSAQYAKRTHCANGHRLGGDNSIDPTRGRECRQCKLERDRRRMALKRIAFLEASQPPMKQGGGR